MISTEIRDGISIVRLNRPARHNALVPEMCQALVDELHAAGEARRPIVLSATGSAFCPGADLKWLAAQRDVALGVAELVAVHHLAITALLTTPVPVVAALNGAVAGGGLGLALAADYRLAGRSASFTSAYFRLGLTPDGGSSVFLERVIGRARSLELLLTNRRLDADQALAWGLVNRVVDDQHLIEQAVAFASELAPVPTYTLLETRRLLDTTDISNQLQLEAVAIRTAARGAWFREALAAFVRAHPD